MPVRQVTINIPEEDCLWLEKIYGDTWIERLEQHIQHEVGLRRHDQEPLRMRKPWDY